MSLLYADTLCQTPARFDRSLSTSLGKEKGTVRAAALGGELAWFLA